MVSKSVRVSYMGDENKRFTRTFRGVRADADQEQVIDFVTNSSKLVNGAGYISASLITSEFLEI